MYTLEYCSDKDWETWQTGIESREEAISLLYSAQVFDTHNDIARVWRVTPSPWE
jgi:hypothetical protein